MARAADLIGRAKRPMLIAGGGVHYADATETLRVFAERHGIPVVETVAGKSTLTHDHPNYAGPIGVTGSRAANAVAEGADVVISVGTRLQDFTTGSWSVFQDPDVRFIGINTASWDAHKQNALPVIGDAKVTLEAIDAALADYAAPPEWLASADERIAEWHAYLDSWAGRRHDGPPAYAEVIQAINAAADPEDYIVSAAGGLPGELSMGWRSKSVGSFDSEYGYSTMGYEIAGAWGARLARPTGDVIAWVGDGSYLMMNSDIYSTVMTGQKVIFMVCDNGGYAVINRLQVNTGGAEFNNLLLDDPSRALLPGRLRQARRVDGRHRRARRVGRRPAGGLRPRQGRRPELRHRRPDRPVHLDRGRRVVGGRRARGQRPTGGRRGPRGAGRTHKRHQRVGV